jgi:protein phosphatase
MRRSNNQDSFSRILAADDRDWMERGHVFLVADGMGAHAAGELASKLAADNIPHTYKKLLELPPPVALEKAIQDANALIHSRGQGAVDFHGMGTTCGALALFPFGALVGHVGDSRIYRLRHHKLEQLTFDHSLLWETMASTNLPEGAMPSFIPKNVITRSLGPNAHVKIDLEGYFPLEIGDTFLLCSDGLTGPVNDVEIGAILDNCSAEEAVETLINLANLRGGPDNITAIIARLTAQHQMPAEFEYSSPRDKDAGKVHPAVWVAIAVCVLTAIIMVASGAGFVPLLLSALAAMVAGGVAISQMVKSGPGTGGPLMYGPLGKAPYRTYDCEANPEIVAQFAATLGRIRETGITGDTPIDWVQFDGFCRSAESAATSRHYGQAIAHYARAIRFVMEQIRALRKKAQHEPPGA